MSRSARLVPAVDLSDRTDPSDRSDHGCWRVRALVLLAGALLLPLGGRAQEAASEVRIPRHDFAMLLAE